MKRQRPRAGDFFTISVGDAHLAVGQVLEPIPDALNSIGIALWKPRQTIEYQRPLLTDPPLAVLLVTPDLLKRGNWKILDTGDPMVSESSRPYEQYRSNGWVGATIIGSGVAQKFLAASVGLWPWDKWADPTYLDTLLLPGQARPAEAVMHDAS